MKRLLTGAGLAALLLSACQTARTQNEPTVIVVPPDEMSRQPSLGPSTTGTSAAPSPAPATTGTTAPAYASLPKPETPAAVSTCLLYTSPSPRDS